MINPTHDPLFVALRAYVLALIPDIEVIQGLGNGVPMPEGQFVCLTARAQRRLSTNETTYADPGIGAGTKLVKQATEYSIQVDCYGPSSSDHATTIGLMWIDPYACNLLAPYGCQPLFANDPTQSALVNGEENYEQRWMLTAVLQFNPVVTVAQEFADVLEVELVNVDATYPPS